MPQDPTKKITKDLLRELDVVLAEMRDYENAYKARKEKRDAELRRSIDAGASPART